MTEDQLHDVDVQSRDQDLGEHPKPWLVVYASGHIVYHDTEDAACEHQQAHRVAIGLDPITGERP